MTSSNKVDLLVKHDGTAVPLIETSRQRQPKYQNAGRACRFLSLLILLGLIIFGCFSVYKVLNKHTKIQLQYNVYYPSQSSWKKGKMGFNENEALSMFASENVITLTDGYARTTAVKINTTTPGLTGSVCLVRNDEDYGTTSSRILPKHNTLDTLMKKTISERQIDVVMHEEVWVPDVFNAVDFDKLPGPVKDLCDEVPIYMMILREEGDDDDYDDERDSYYDDSDDVSEDDDVTDDDASESTTTVSYKDIENYDSDDNEAHSEQDEQNPPYYGLPPPKLSDDDDDDDDDDEYDDDEYEDDYYEMEQDFTTSLPESLTTFEGDWFFRKKRQAISNKNGAEQDNQEEEDMVDHDSELSLGESESDADLQCCHHCKKPYLICSQVCVPIQQLTYPYYYRSCKYTQCSMMMPCAWWLARAAGLETDKKKRC